MVGRHSPPVKHGYPELVPPYELRTACLHKVETAMELNRREGAAGRRRVPPETAGKLPNRSARTGGSERVARSLRLDAVAALVLWAVSEHTWWGTLLTFCPRRPFLLPPALLLAASLFLHRPSILTNLLCLALVGGPLMGGRARFDLFAPREPGRARARASSVATCRNSGPTSRL